MRQENPNSERKSSSLVEERRLFSILKTAVCVAVQFTYGLAQNIIGLTMFLWNRKNEHFVFKNNIVTMWDKSHSMGCGMFIFLSSRRMHYDTAKDIKFRYDILVHEYGHTVQSLILGPLFLPIIAIPSVTWAFLNRSEDSGRKEGCRIIGCIAKNGQIGWVTRYAETKGLSSEMKTLRSSWKSLRERFVNNHHRDAARRAPAPDKRRDVLQSAALTRSLHWPGTANARTGSFPRSNASASCT